MLLPLVEMHPKHPSHLVDISVSLRPWTFRPLCSASQKEIGALLCAPALFLCYYPICYNLLIFPASWKVFIRAGMIIYSYKSLAPNIQCKFKKYLISEWISYVIFELVKVGLRGKENTIVSHHLSLVTEAGENQNHEKFQGILVISTFKLSSWCLSAGLNSILLTITA